MDTHKAQPYYKTLSPQAVSLMDRQIMPALNADDIGRTMKQYILMAKDAASLAQIMQRVKKVMCWQGVDDDRIVEGREGLANAIDQFVQATAAQPNAQRQRLGQALRSMGQDQAAQQRNYAFAYAAEPEGMVKMSDTDISKAMSVFSKHNEGYLKVDGQVYYASVHKSPKTQQYTAIVKQGGPNGKTLGMSAEMPYRALAVEFVKSAVAQKAMTILPLRGVQPIPRNFLAKERTSAEKQISAYLGKAVKINGVGIEADGRTIGTLTTKSGVAVAMFDDAVMHSDLTPVPTPTAEQLAEMPPYEGKPEEEFYYAAIIPTSLLKDTLGDEADIRDFMSRNESLLVGKDKDALNQAVSQHDIKAAYPVLKGIVDNAQYPQAVKDMAQTLLSGLGKSVFTRDGFVKAVDGSMFVKDAQYDDCINYAGLALDAGGWLEIRPVAKGLDVVAHKANGSTEATYGLAFLNAESEKAYQRQFMKAAEVGQWLRPNQSPNGPGAQELQATIKFSPGAHPVLYGVIYNHGNGWAAEVHQGVPPGQVIAEAEKPFGTDMEAKQWVLNWASDEPSAKVIGVQAVRSAADLFRQMLKGDATSATQVRVLPKIVQAAMGVTTNFLAQEVNLTDREVLDKVQAAFVGYCEANADSLTKTWLDAWQEFWPDYRSQNQELLRVAKFVDHLIWKYAYPTVTEHGHIESARFQTGNDTYLLRVETQPGQSETQATLRIYKNALTRSSLLLEREFASIDTAEAFGDQWAKQLMEGEAEKLWREVMAKDGVSYDAPVVTLLNRAQQARDWAIVGRAVDTLKEQGFHNTAAMLAGARSQNNWVQVDAVVRLANKVTKPLDPNKVRKAAGNPEVERTLASLNKDGWASQVGWDTFLAVAKQIGFPQDKIDLLLEREGPHPVVDLELDKDGLLKVRGNHYGVQDYIKTKWDTFLTRGEGKSARAEMRKAEPKYDESKPVTGDPAEEGAKPKVERQPDKGVDATEGQTHVGAAVTPPPLPVRASPTTAADAVALESVEVDTSAWAAEAGREPTVYDRAKWVFMIGSDHEAPEVVSYVGQYGAALETARAYAAGKGEKKISVLGSEAAKKAEGGAASADGRFPQDRIAKARGNWNRYAYVDPETNDQFKTFKEAAEYHRTHPNSVILRNGSDLVFEGDEKSWCPKCAKVVEPEGDVDVQGMYNKCPNCGERLPEPTGKAVSAGKVMKHDDQGAEVVDWFRTSVKPMPGTNQVEIRLSNGKKAYASRNDDGSVFYNPEGSVPESVKPMVERVLNEMDEEAVSDEDVTKYLKPLIHTGEKPSLECPYCKQGGDTPDQIMHSKTCPYYEPPSPPAFVSQTDYAGQSEQGRTTVRRAAKPGDLVKDAIGDQMLQQIRQQWPNPYSFRQSYPIKITVNGVTKTFDAYKRSAGSTYYLSRAGLQSIIHRGAGEGGKDTKEYSYVMINYVLHGNGNLEQVGSGRNLTQQERDDWYRKHGEEPPPPAPEGEQTVEALLGISDLAKANILTTRLRDHTLVLAREDPQHGTNAVTFMNLTQANRKVQDLAAQGIKALVYDGRGSTKYIQILEGDDKELEDAAAT